VARPSDYSPELGEAICARLIEEPGTSIRRICAAEDMPSRSTVLRWLTEHKEFQGQYARAKELQADLLVEEAMDIADDTENDFKEVPVGDEGASVSVVDHEHISRSRLRVDTRKWAAGKLAPKKYGDRVALTGAEDAPPIGIEDKTPKVTRRQVHDELTAIFDEAAALVDDAAEDTARVDRPVRKGAKRGGRQKPRAPAPGKKVARKK
jgi:hypothetical protein